MSAELLSGRIERSLRLVYELLEDNNYYSACSYAGEATSVSLELPVTVGKLVDERLKAFEIPESSLACIYEGINKDIGRCQRILGRRSRLISEEYMLILTLRLSVEWTEAFLIRRGIRVPVIDYEQLDQEFAANLTVAENKRALLSALRTLIANTGLSPDGPALRPFLDRIAISL